MNRPALWTRRSVPVPTLLGWACIVLAAAAAGEVSLRALHPCLATNAAAGHGLLVVEGWIDEPGLSSAGDLFRGGRYEAIVTVGGPIDERWGFSSAYPSYAERAAAYLLQREGLDPARVFPVLTPASEQNRTYLAARAVRDWLDDSRRQVRALDVYTQGPHARRSRRLYRMVLSDSIEVGVLSAPPTRYDAAAWWRSSEGARAVISETAGWIWTLCCFRGSSK